MFTHLHVHTEYSLLDGMCRIPELVQRAKSLGMSALAMTDHGNLHGVVEFYEEAKKAGIKPIVGCEVYVAPEGRKSKKSADKQPYHLILLAKNDTGYKNLVQLVSQAHLDGYYYKPRIDRELMEQYKEGIIALSGCLTAEVPRLISEGRPDDARKAAEWYDETFDDYYFELQRHEGIPQLEKVNDTLIEWSRDMGIPLVATNDLHYTAPEDAEYHDILLCIQTNSTRDDAKRMRLDDQGFYLRSEEEMRALFPEVPEAIENTQRIADMCDLQLEFDRLLLPQIELPPGKESVQYLEELCWSGLQGRFSEPTEEQRQRLVYELDVINKMGFADYFLVVWDIVAYARGRNILLGVRGSAAASLVLYCLGITSIDPLEHTLVFERFLNLERKELPDIDLDFQDDRREEVIEYVTRKYGQERVAQIITFGTLGARAALRDTGRALGMPYADVDRVARLVPGGPHPGKLDQVMAQVPEFKELYEQDPKYRELVDIAIHLEGIARHASTHAAGIVISKDPLIDHIPLQRPARGSDDEGDTVMTQWDMNAVAKAGLIKMDFLGLTNLTILARARDIITETRNVPFDLESIPFDDKKTFDLLSKADTTAVFQLEGGGMRRYIQQLQPSSLHELAAMIALYRPGPMEHIPAYTDAKFGRTPIRYPHDDLAPILEETYGIIVYQDQVLHIVQRFAGYTLGEADTVRKAMGKKIATIMAEEKGKFLSGALKLGYPQSTAEAVFDLIEPFAGYAFNKAHSVSYAVIAYQTAYLKANYPVEFFAAALNSYFGQTERTGIVTEECQRRGIVVEPPDVNKSNVMFTVENIADDGTGVIRFGLGAIKNVGTGAVTALVEARDDGGPFESVEDFCRRAGIQGLNRRVLESLVKTGAFDSFGVSRGALLNSIDRLIALAQSEQRMRGSTQTTMFDMMGESAQVVLPTLDVSGVDATREEKVTWEKELTGTVFTEDPRRRAFRNIEKPAGVYDNSEISPDMNGKRVTVRGQVVSLRSFFTRQGESAVAVRLQDLLGEIEVVAWPDLYKETSSLWTVGNFLQVRGRVRAREDEVSLTTDDVEELRLPTGDAPEEEAPSDNDVDAETFPEPLTPESNGAIAVAVASHPTPAIAVAPPQTPAARAVQRSSCLTVLFHESDDEERDRELMDRLWAVLEAHEGRDAVRLVIDDGERKIPLAVPQTIDWSAQLESEIHELAGLEILHG